MNKRISKYMYRLRWPVLFAFMWMAVQTAVAQDFEPGAVWNDTDGNVIDAHGGGIVYYKGVYYWFGEYRQSKEEGFPSNKGVSCYSSKDLYHWKNEGMALEVVADTTSEITRGCNIERPKVIYNAKTGKFVMWFHLELKGKGYGAAKTAVAISDTPAGPYTFVKSYRPNAGKWPQNFEESWQQPLPGQDTLKWWTASWADAVKKGLFVRRDFEKGQMSRDMSLFIDDDGKAYHIHSSEENLTLHIAELTPDYLDFTGKYITIAPAGHNEAPALFKQDGVYYLITSGCTGWDPNAARSFKSTSIWGPWEELDNPCIGEDAGLTFHSQSTFIFPIHGKKNAFIFMADRWKPGDLKDSRYIWLPVTVQDGKPRLQWYDHWTLNGLLKHQYEQ